MSEIKLKALKPLPEPLPKGERVLWQHSPSWKSYARRGFFLNKLALYFLVIIVWVAASAYVNTGELVAVMRALSWAIPPALGVLLLVSAFAWLYARTSVYTITDKRLVIQSGLSFQTFVNLPYSKVISADLRTYKDGTGDIELLMSGPRLLYSMLWPNLRWFRLNKTTPMLRSLDQPEKVAEILSQALAADQPSETTSGLNDQADAQELESSIRRTAAS